MCIHECAGVHVCLPARIHVNVRSYLPYFFLIFLDLFILVDVMNVWHVNCVCMRCWRTTEEIIPTFGIGVIDGCEPHVGVEN